MSKAKNHDRVWKRYRDVIYECVRDGRAQRLGSGTRTLSDGSVVWQDPRSREWSTVSTSFGEQEQRYLQLTGDGLSKRRAAEQVLSEIPGATYCPSVFWNLLRVAGPHQSWALSSSGFSRLCRQILKGDPRFQRMEDGSWRVIPDILASALQPSNDEKVSVHVTIPTAVGKSMNVTWPSEASILKQEAFSLGERAERVGNAGYGVLISRLLSKLGIFSSNESYTPMEVAGMLLGAADDERVLREVSQVMRGLNENNQ